MTSSRALLALVVLSLTGCTASQAEGVPSPAATSKAPDFALTSVEGKTVRLSDYLGRDVVLLDFWATWCTPCLGELPHLQELYAAHRAEGLTVIGIDMDGPETVANVESIVRRYGLQFPVLLDEETRVVAQYNPARDAPFAVLIDRSGKVIERRTGYTPGDEVSLEAKVKELLAAGRAQ